MCISRVCVFVLWLTDWKHLIPLKKDKCLLPLLSCFSLGHFNLERQTAATFSSSQVEVYKLTGSRFMWQTNKTETLFFVGYKTTLQINNQQPTAARRQSRSKDIKAETFHRWRRTCRGNIRPVIKVCGQSSKLPPTLFLRFISMSQKFPTGFHLHMTLAGLLPSYAATTWKEFNRKY